MDKSLFDNANNMVGGSAIYDALMRVKPTGLSANAWAVKAKVNRAVWVNMREHGNPTRKTLEKLLDAIGLTFADFEAAGAGLVRTEVRGTGLTPEQLERTRAIEGSKPVPMLGTAFGGDWEEEIELTELHLSEVLDYLARPPSLVKDDEAYAIEIIGESMAPRFKPGERAFVSPKAPIRPGDDVIVQLTDPEAEGDLERRVTMVLIKEMVRRTSTYVELKQYRPETTFRVPADRIRRMHRVRDRL